MSKAANIDPLAWIIKLKAYHLLTTVGYVRIHCVTSSFIVLEASSVLPPDDDIELYVKFCILFSNMFWGYGKGKWE